jgi:Methyltransferase domain
MSPVSNGPLSVLEDQVWQMSGGERAAVEGILAWLRPRVAIEIGTAQGAALGRIAAYAEEAHSFDLTPPSLSLPDNVVLHTGDSHELLPRSLSAFAQAETNVDFVLVDGDHSPEGVRQDLEDLLDSRAVAHTVILIHDTANERVRAGVDSVHYAAWPKVVHVDLDWIPGRLFAGPELRNELWYGLGLVVVDSAQLAYRDRPVFEQRYHPAGPLLRQVAAAVRAREAVPPTLDSPEAQAGALRVRAAHLERELAVQQDRADGFARQLAIRQEQWEGAERALQNIKGSMSWKLTEPVRAIKGRGRGRPR